MRKLLWIGKKLNFRINFKFLILKILLELFIFHIILSTKQDEADEIEYKYLNEFNNDHLSLITNFIFEKGVGSKASGSTTFDLSNQLMLKNVVIADVDIGVVGFSTFGEVSSFETFGSQKHLYGVQFETEFEFDKFDYETSLSYLHGLTDASTNHMFLWNMELEF